MVRIHFLSISSKFNVQSLLAKSAENMFLAISNSSPQRLMFKRIRFGEK